MPSPHDRPLSRARTRSSRSAEWVIAAALVLACTSSQADTPEERPSLVGWVAVDADRAELLGSDAGHPVDEMVGPLVQAGLDLEAARWLKPTYGSQNLLFVTQAEKIGTRYVEQALRVAPQTVPPGQVEQSEEHAGGRRWRLTRITQTGTDFETTILTCPHGGGETVVFSWGDEPERFSGDVQRLLEQLAPRCDTK